MKPSEKSKEVEEFLDRQTQEWFGRKRTDSIEGNICVICGESAMDFRDSVSRKEYSISGMCQRCQDNFFVADDDVEDEAPF